MVPKMAWWNILPFELNFQKISQWKLFSLFFSFFFFSSSILQNCILLQRRICIGDACNCVRTRGTIYRVQAVYINLLLLVWWFSWHSNTRVTRSVWPCHVGKGVQWRYAVGVFFVFQFLNVPMFRNVTLKCLTEIAGVSVNQYEEQFVNLFTLTMMQLKQVKHTLTHLNKK